MFGLSSMVERVIAFAGQRRRVRGMRTRLLKSRTRLRMTKGIAARKRNFAVGDPRCNSACGLKKPLGDRKTFEVALITFGTPTTIRKSAKLYGVYTVRGGARRNRTADLFNAIEALSQLSYDPEPLEITRRADSEQHSVGLTVAIRAAGRTQGGCIALPAPLHKPK